MVEDQAVVTRCAAVVACARMAARFPATLPAEAEAEKQLEDRHKWTKKLAFRECLPATEKDLERWVDDAAKLVKKHQACPAIFQELWEAQCMEGVGRVVADSQTEDYEKLVDCVALRLFPHSGWIADLELEFMRGQRQGSVMDPALWVTTTAACYLRLCARRKWDVSVSDSRMKEILLTSLPRAVEMRVRSDKAAGIEAILDAAHFHEEHLQREYGMVPAMPAVPETVKKVHTGSSPPDATTPLIIIMVLTLWDLVP